MLSTDDVFVNGVRSAVYDAGPKQPEAVVFVHGNPGPLDDWEELAPAVSSFCRAIAVDMPGFGRADHPRDFDFTVEGYARHLAGVLERLEVRRAHLVMHDFGGPWGLRWAADHPQAVASLTLINTGMMRGYEWHGLAKLWQTPLVGELLMFATPPALMRYGMNRANPKPLPPRFFERVLRYADRNHKRAVLKLYRASRDPEVSLASLLSPIAALNPPTCVIWGAADPFLPVRFAEQQKEFFPRAEVHALAGLGHWPFLDDAEAVSERILPFLRRQVSAPSVQGDAIDRN